MTKKRILAIAVLSCLAVGLIGLSTAVPAQAGNMHDKAHAVAQAATFRGWECLLDTWMAASPFRFIWTGLRSQPGLDQFNASGAGGATNVGPPVIFGGDDGFISNGKQ